MTTINPSFRLIGHSIRCWLAAVLVVVCPVQALADDEMVTINMRNADIGAVIQWIAEQTNKKIVIDPRVRGKVTVLANQPMTVDQAFNVFLTTLDVYGFTATESGGILRIAPAAMANSSPTDIVDNFASLGGARRVVYVVKIEQVSAKELTRILKPMVPSTGYIEAYSATNSIVIADESENVKRLVALIEQIDRSGDLSLDIVRLQYASAEKVAGVVESLIKPDAERPFSIASDVRSNSLIMSGDSGTRAQVKRLASQLDQPISRAGSTRVIYLHYLDAKEVQPILQGMSGVIAEKNEDNANSVQVNIEISESANALIMTGSPDILTAMEEVIAKVDIRRAQVLVEAIIVEISQDLARNLGVEWNTALNNDGVEAITNFGSRGVNTDGEVVTNLLSNGLNLGFYQGGSLRGLIKALATTTDANILSTPSIMTLDNQEAEILVGSNVPLITGQTLLQSSTRDGDSTVDPFTTYERQDIGLTLKITPQVNRGDSITLDVLQEMESISDSTTVANDIVTNKRSIKTKVLVEDDSILVLGGLISDEQIETVNKVPFFGDIPLIGALFRSTENSVVKKNLMVFIHPVIIASDSTAEKVSSDKYQLMQKLQQRFINGEPVSGDIKLEDFERYQPAEKRSPESQ